MIRALFLLVLGSILFCQLPAHAITAAEVIGADRKLTLQEAIDLALENNLGLQVSRIDPALSRLGVDESEGAYDPRIVGAATFSSAETPIASAVQAAFGSGNIIEEDTWNYSGGLQGLLPWGLTYGSTYALNRVKSTSGFNALFPEHRGQWKNEVSMPLLRDLYWNSVDLSVRRSYVLRDVSDEDFRKQLSDTVFDIESAYWALNGARESESVAEKSLETARAVLEQTQVQYEVGVVSKVSVAQAEAGVAQREYDAINTRNASDAAQDRLLNLIIAPDLRGFGRTRIRTQEPTFVVYEIDSEAAIQKAFSSRPELASARKRVEDAELQESFASNQRLPQLDLSGSYAMDGLAGAQKTPTPDLGIPRGSGGVNDKFFRADGARSWTVGANIEIPIGNDVADSRFARSKIELRRTKTRLRQEEQNVTVDVRNAVRDLASAIQKVKAAERNVAASNESLRAEQERLRLGDSTPRNVLEVEEDLATAEKQEIDALQEYAIAISALERAQGSLLESRGINLEEEMNRLP